MQEPELQTHDSNGKNGCASCGQLLTNNIHKTPLCDSCRHHFIRFPIPLWIKLFGGGVLLLVLYGLVSLPKNISTGIHYQRAQKAAEMRNYVTAQKELEYVVAKEPTYLEARCKLLVAAAHNLDLVGVSNAYQAIGDTKIDNDVLYSEVSEALNKFGRYLPSDSLSAFIEEKHTSLNNLSIDDFRTYVTRNREDNYALTQLATLLLNQDQYKEADSISNIVLSHEPDFEPAIMAKPYIKRELMQFDSSYYYADRLLSTNQENLFAYSCKVRTMLKQKRDDEAVALAQSCYQKNPHDAYTLASLAMAYYYQGNTRQCNAILQEASKDTTAIDQIAYVKDVISGKEHFRN